jgi:hypothetical protein
MTHLITAHEQIARALDGPLVNVEQQLNALYGRGLGAHDFISRAGVAAREIDEKGPKNRRPGDCLAWLRDHWERVEPAESGVKSKVWRGWWRSIETRFSRKEEEAPHDPKPAKKLANILFDSGRSCDIRFPIMGQTISVHRVMIVSGDKSEVFLTSGWLRYGSIFLTPRFQRNAIFSPASLRSSP